MAATSDVVTGHVPDRLIYGPVASRRFGRSLGVSCDPPGLIGCAWACPYCQLGDQPRGAAGGHAPAARIIAELRAGLAAHASACDVLCVAGNGEPTDHPEFPLIATTCAREARAHGLRSVLLSNGDGLLTPAVACACEQFDEVQIKFDPGPLDGAWRRFDPAVAERRRRALRRLPELRIQALLFRGPGAAPGNSDAHARGRWLADLIGMPVVAVDLTTVARGTRRAGIRPVDATVLADWRRECEQVLTAQVRTFGEAAA